MAPVGSYESLMAAIQGGADSVYFGIGSLNMRARSSFNFDISDLEKITAICRDNKIASYLTVNTVVYDDEIEEMHQMIDAAKNNDVSAIIASDMSVIRYCRKVGMEVHASTQLNISNTEALAFFAGFCDVIVTARELNLDQVRKMHDTIMEHSITGPNGNFLQLEVFVHGALCMAVSGKCYLSLHEFNKSANRGACYQTCRRAYTVTDKETGYELEVDNEYIMSPKDLKTIGFLDEIIRAGVTVFKIEGRARSAEYVKTVTACYNEAIHAVLDGSFGAEKVTEWDKRLAAVFNRGFWDGYYLGQGLGEWADSYGSQSTYRKQYLGKGMNYFDKLQVADFLIETGELSLGDTVLISGTTTGVIEHEVSGMRVDDREVKVAQKGDRISFPLPQKIRRSDKLYKLVKR